MSSSPRRILAIESSCDETAAAVVEGHTILGETVATQAELHQRFGGVVPEIASRRHLELVDFVIQDALEQARIDDISELDAIAATQGPGLIGALLVGFSAGKARAWAADIPFIPVDHLLGHVASAMLSETQSDEPLRPPFLCLLVSGGHTLVLDVNEKFEVSLLGTTRDDAAGEAFDKGARLLGLGMPGGPALAQLAAQAQDSENDANNGVHIPAAMLHHETLDTSFSGIKTALSIALKERAARNRISNDQAFEGSTARTPTDAQLAAAYQAAIVKTLAGSVRKLLKRRGARSNHPDRRQTLALVGGVAANLELRKAVTKLCTENDMRVVATPLRWCGDNAAMIGVAAQYSKAYSGKKAAALDAYATSRLFRDGKLLPSG